MASGEPEQAEFVHRVGDLVYSVHNGATQAVPLLRVGHTPVTNHSVVRVTLNDGVVLEMSAGPPTGEGRHFDELTPGVNFDEMHRVMAVETIPYMHPATYDILPASNTGTYYAGGALVGSTLNSNGSGRSSLPSRGK